MEISKLISDYFSMEMTLITLLLYTKKAQHTSIIGDVGMFPLFTTERIEAKKSVVRL